MKSFKLKNRRPRFRDIDGIVRDDSTEPKVDDARAAATTGTVQPAEVPPKSITISPQIRIVELNDEILRLKVELEFYKNLIDDVLLRIMPIILYHSSGLYSTVQKCHASIEQANSQRAKFWK